MVPRDWSKALFFLALVISFAISAGILLNAYGLEHAGKLGPFTSDGCSRFPDGPPEAPDKWRNCCLQHDRAYWLGGTFNERVAADRALQQCIADVENPALGEAMWAGVRVGGSPLWPTQFRWGYGWPYTRGYRPVTAEERRLAQTLLAETSAREPSER